MTVAPFVTRTSQPSLSAAEEFAARRDDLRLAVGRGRYIDDLPVPGALHMAIVRSPYAHATVDDVDTSAALEVPGVRAVFTGKQIAAELSPFPGVVRSAPPYYPLAVDRVRYVGEPIAVVLADDRYCAEDGAGAVWPDLTELPAVVDLEEAAADGAPLLHDRDSNVVWSRTYRYGDPAAAFDSAAHIVSIEATFPRYNSTPLETYALVADWDVPANELTVRSNFQGPFSLQPVMCRALGLQTHQLRLIAAEDIGGSFGIKAMIYPYITLAGVASKLSGRPVVWVEDRQEHLYGSASGTNRVSQAHAAVSDDGKIVGLRFEILEDVGAYLRAPEPSCVMRSVSMFAGPYDVPDGEVDVRVVVTNKLPTGLNRGYGGQQHIFTLERLVDAVADELKLDPAEVRRRNFIRRESFPYVTPSGTRYDSGDYEAALDLVLERSGYGAQREVERDRGDRWVGFGLATAVHSSAANMGYVTLALEPDDRAAPRYRPKSGMRDWAQIRVDPSGKILVEIGSAGCGQGHRETAAGIVARALEISPADIVVLNALDTGRSPWSVSSGSYSSRFAVMTGNAVHRAAEQLRGQLLDASAIVLGVDRSSLSWSQGVAVTPTGGRASLRELAGAVHWDGSSLGENAPQLVVSATFEGAGVAAPDEGDRVNAALAYGFMADVAVVEIDKQTFMPRLRSYFAVHDVGHTLEPKLVVGQVTGGVIHGLGGALLEHLAYSADGQLLNGSLMDYLCVTASDAPHVDVAHANVPSPFNPLGVKGGGESSAMSAPAAIAAAVEDALRHASVRISALPVDPADLWQRAHEAAQ
jgi:2-furoyl-CoA dehydrogenase large subunit